MNKIIVVSKGSYHPTIDEVGCDVVMSPFVKPEPPGGANGIAPLKLAILRAMRQSVELSDVGDLIVQDDVSMSDDPFRFSVESGRIRTLVSPTFSGRHFCPQAFIVPDEETRLELIRCWTSEDSRSCRAWAHIEKVYDYTPATHIFGWNKNG